VEEFWSSKPAVGSSNLSGRAIFLKGEKIVRKIIEIRAAEGGEDSKLFVSDLAQAYVKLGMKLG
jgi:hypothetical protein